MSTLLRLAVLVLLEGSGIGQGVVVTANTNTEVLPCITDKFSQCLFELPAFEYEVRAYIQTSFPKGYTIECEPEQVNLTGDEAITVHCRFVPVETLYIPLAEGD